MNQLSDVYCPKCLRTLKRKPGEDIPIHLCMETDRYYCPKCKKSNELFVPEERKQETLYCPRCGTALEKSSAHG